MAAVETKEQTTPSRWWRDHAIGMALRSLVEENAGYPEIGQEARRLLALEQGKATGK